MPQFDTMVVAEDVSFSSRADLVAVLDAAGAGQAALVGTRWA